MRPKDIDSDFATNIHSGMGKDSLVEYLVNKYGRDHVANVGNRLYYYPKSVLRDLAQVYDIPSVETQKCTKEYNDELSVEDNIKNNNVVNSFFKKYPILKNKVDKIIGTMSSLGTHAGGVVITDKQFPLKKYCALQRPNEDGNISTLWTKDEIQDIGIIKYDILGLTTAGQNHLIKEMIGIDPYTDFKEDEEVYRNIVLTGKHKNIFQFESQLGRRAFEDLKPMTFMELSNASGIIRVLGTKEGRDMYEDYSKRVAQIQMGDKDSWKEKIREEIFEDRNYEAVVRVLNESYGILIYQEQLANMVKELSGGKKTFTDGNKVRKLFEFHKKTYGSIEAIQGNKIALKKWHEAFMEVMNAYVLPYLGKDGWDSPDKNIQGFLHFKLDKENILPVPQFGIIKWFISSTSYLFSKLHSVAYTMNSYNAMYLKHYYPLEFWTGSLTYEQENLEKVKSYITAIQLETNIEILGPDINKSDYFFKIEDGKIRFGLRGILQVGEAAYTIIQERKNRGDYKSIKDFVMRLKNKKVNKRTIEALLYSSAFSSCVGSITDAYKALKDEGVALEELNDEYINLSTLETKYLGVPITYVNPLLKQAKGYIPVTSFEDGDKFDVAIHILDLKKKTTKNNKPYTMLKCQCLNSLETFNVFDWNNNAMGFNKNEFKVIHIKKNGDFFQLVMQKGYQQKSKNFNFSVSSKTKNKLRLKTNE